MIHLMQRVSGLAIGWGDRKCLVDTGNLWASHLGPGVNSIQGAVLDQREVPKCQLGRTAGKNGGTNCFPRTCASELKACTIG